MKGKFFVPTILCSLILTSCGSGGYSDAQISNDAKSYDYAADDTDYYEDYSSGSSEVEQSSAESNNGGSESDSEVIKKEMLVYSCNMTVDVLNFEEAIDSFKESLDNYGGFVENESYNDGGSSGRYYYKDEEKWQTYSATVRVPSAEYDNFCDSAASLGDLRSKDASVENVSSEYYDLSTTLEIYEAKEKRYIDMLAEITDDAYAVTVEKELTQLQVQIAQIKTRMNEIRTDVAYSYVNISINEVKEYKAEPIKTDTFGQRLSAVLSETASGFLEFLEGLLFLIIHLLPYFVLIGIVIAAVSQIIRKRKAHKAKKAAEKANQPYAASAPMVYPPMQTAADPQQAPTQRNSSPQSNPQQTDSQEQFPDSK